MVALCIDLGGTSIKIGLLAAGKILSAKEVPVTGLISDLDVIRQEARRMRTRHDAELRIDAVAVAVPGIIDPARGALLAAHDKYPYAIGMDLRSWAADAFQIPAVIENDARAALLGETTFGVARGETDVVLMTLGTGIGTAATMGGRLLRGAHDHAAILGGHMTVDLFGPTCKCGNRGCAEALASTWAVPTAIRNHPAFAGSEDWKRELAAGPVGIQELFEASDDVASDVLQRFLTVWGATAVSLCHSYDPSMVIITGGVMRSAERVLAPLRDYIDAHLWSSFPRPVVTAPARPDVSVLLGLCALVESPRKDTL